MDLGLYPEARKQLERAQDLHRRVLGPKNPETLKTTIRTGHAAFLQGNYPEAEALLGHTLDIQRRVLGPEHPDTLMSMNYLAAVYEKQGKYAQAGRADWRTAALCGCRRPPRYCQEDRPRAAESLCARLCTEEPAERREIPSDTGQGESAAGVALVAGPLAVGVHRSLGVKSSGVYDIRTGRASTAQSHCYRRNSPHSDPGLLRASRGPLPITPFQLLLPRRFGRGKCAVDTADKTN
jgi:hypothetical protein